ncbi:MAG: hypothetical protein Q9166_004190 [cf. Caloplaca sp. 2 TL-2023]
MDFTESSFYTLPLDATHSPVLIVLLLWGYLRTSLKFYEAEVSVTSLACTMPQKARQVGFVQQPQVPRDADIEPKCGPTQEPVMSVAQNGQHVTGGVSFEKMTNALSAMDIDQGYIQGSNHPGATVENLSSNAQWRSLTASALSSRDGRRRPLLRSDESFNNSFYDQRSATNKHATRRRRRIKMDEQAPAVLHTQVSEGRLRPATLNARIESSLQAGLISKRLANEMRLDQHKFLAAKAARVEKLRDQRVLAASKAKQEARTKAVERALQGLQLGPKATAMQAEPPLLQPLLLSLSYAMTIITNPNHAEKAFNHLQPSLEDRSYIGRLSSNDRRRVLLLLDKEDELQAKVKKVGSLEAALVHQDERIAFAKEKKALRDGFLLADEGYSEGLDGEEQLAAGFSLTTSNVSKVAKAAIALVAIAPVSQYQSVLDAMTDHQKAADQQTAEDLISFQRNPNIQLPKKRQNRLRSALSLGRTDLCAMDVERRRAKAQEFNKWEEKRRSQQEPGNFQRRRSGRQFKDSTSAGLQCTRTRRGDSYRPPPDFEADLTPRDDGSRRLNLRDPARKNRDLKSPEFDAERRMGSSEYGNRRLRTEGVPRNRYNSY